MGDPRILNQPRGRPQRSSSDAGFTLIESLLAAGVLAVGVAGFFGAVLTVMSLNETIR